MHTDNHPRLILIRGLPGSGKSYLTTALKEAIGTDKVVTLDPDATDYSSKAYLDFVKALTAEGVEEKFHPYRFVRAGAYKGIDAGKIVIWNQAFTNLDGFEKTVKNLQTYAADHGMELPLLVVEVAIKPETAQARVNKREKEGGHGVPDEVFTRFTNDYVSFADKGFTTVIVHGEDEISTSVATVIKALGAL